MSTDDPAHRELRALIDEERRVPPLPEVDVERIWSRVEASVRAPIAPAANPAAAATTTSAWIAGVAVATLTAVIVGFVIFASSSDGPVVERAAAVPSDVVSPAPSSLDVVDPISAAESPPGTDVEPAVPPEEVGKRASGDAVNAPAVAFEPPPAHVAPATSVETPATPQAGSVPARSGAPSSARVPRDGVPSSTSEAPREIDLLREARKRLVSGDARGALQVVETHQQFWPGGALGEERDALRIRALLGAGDLVGARAALATFEARYPASIHLAALRTHASRASGTR